MKKKLLAGLMIAFAVIAPVSSANAADAIEASWRGNGILDVAVPATINSFSTGGSVWISFAGQTFTGVVTGIDAPNGRLTTTISAPFAPYTTLSAYNTDPSAPAPYSAVASFFEPAISWVTGNLLPAIGALVVLGIGVRLSIKAVRKFSKVA